MTTKKEASNNTNINIATLVNHTTGEINEVVSMDYLKNRTQNFWKINRKSFLKVHLLLESIEQIRVFDFIIDNMSPSNNKFTGIYDIIKSETKISRPTVSKVFKVLIANDVIAKLHSGTYIVNPKIIMKGSKEKFNIIFESYTEAQQMREKNGKK